MFSIRRPGRQDIDDFLNRQKDSEITYEPVGLSELSPAGFQTGGYRVVLGYGSGTYERAQRALDTWAGFRLGWLELHADAAQADLGTNVAIAIRSAGLWSLNGCRIVKRFPDDSGDARYGFAYGTLADHGESGEESFTLERTADHAVWYVIRAVSRPRALIARLGAWTLPRIRRRFWRHSGAALIAAVDGGMMAQNT